MDLSAQLPYRESINSSKKAARLPDVILFDIDDTLYSTTRPHQVGMDMVFKELAKITSLDQLQLQQLYLQARNEVKLLLGDTASSHSRLLYFQRLLEYSEARDIPLMSIKLEHLYWVQYLKCISPDSSLRQMMGKIKSKGIKIGIVTDLTARIQMKKLIKLGISSNVDFVVTSEESGLDKPNFVCFMLANQKANPANKEINYWMIGDHLKKDLLGAKIELNAQTFWINPFNRQPSVDCVDHSISSILELSNYI